MNDSKAMNDSVDISLIEPSQAWRDEFLSMAGEYRRAGETRYDEALADFDSYMRLLEYYAAGRGLPEGHVRSNNYWLREGAQLLGRSQLRHLLSPELEHEGGHIGYDIRPARRGRGYGTLILTLTLEKARASGFERVLLTCDTDNTPSARIIERHGGQLDDRRISRRTGKLISRYWITL